MKKQRNSKSLAKNNYPRNGFQIVTHNQHIFIPLSFFIGVYYVLLTAEVIQYGVYLVATKSTLGPTVLLQNAVPITNLQGDNSIRLYYKFVLYPESPARFMNITLFGGHGDADLYVTKGTWPNIQIYDKRSVGGIKDAVFIQSPAAGMYCFLCTSEYGYV